MDAADHNHDNTAADKEAGPEMSNQYNRHNHNAGERQTQVPVQLFLNDLQRQPENQSEETDLTVRLASIT